MQMAEDADELRVPYRDVSCMFVIFDDFSPVLLHGYHHIDKIFAIPSGVTQEAKHNIQLG